MRSVLMEELTWPEVKQAIAEGVTSVIVPVGATEQHGPHLPLATDSLHTVAMLKEVAVRLPALLAPLMPVGCSQHHMAFPGTMTVRQSTLAAVLRDWCQSLSRHGFHYILIYSGHGGNAKPLGEIIANLQAKFGPTRIIGCTDWRVYDDTLFAEASRHGIDRPTAGGHSGELETSMMLALRPELVRMDIARPGYMGDPEAIRPAIFKRGTGSVAEDGVLGDPTPGDGIRGGVYLEAMVDKLTEFFRAAMTVSA